MDYEAVIGLEVHIQLQTASKLFCSCENSFTHDANTHVCPVCLGHPGVLPVLNADAFEKSILASLAIGCTVANFTKFDRKHYYYPDLPKNYQISQYDLPLAENGYLDITVNGEAKRIGITRLHMEEDAGKLIHSSGHSTVDLNRTGTPLAEIVSEPDLRSPAEAREYLQLLRQIIRYIGVSDCEMQEGSLRCDANISLRPVGETELGVKNEIKNMNSFRGVEQALTLVREELLAALKNDEPIEQVTWGYSLDDDRIFKMRTKEYANDYRYFPDPDLPPVTVAPELIERLRGELCEMPTERRARFVADYELDETDAAILTQERDLADYYEAVVAVSSRPRESANWILNDVLRELKERGLTLAKFPVTAATLAELMELIGAKTINMTTAKKLFARLSDGEDSTPKAMVEAEGLGQVSDTGRIEELLDEAIASNPKAVEELENGKLKTAGWFVGQVMQKLKGQGDPQAIGEVLATRFGFDPTVLAKKKKKG